MLFHLLHIEWSYVNSISLCQWSESALHCSACDTACDTNWSCKYFLIVSRGRWRDTAEERALFVGSVSCFWICWFLWYRVTSCVLNTRAISHTSLGPLEPPDGFAVCPACISLWPQSRDNGPLLIQATQQISHWAMSTPFSESLYPSLGNFPNLFPPWVPSLHHGCSFIFS